MILRRSNKKDPHFAGRISTMTIKSGWDIDPKLRKIRQLCICRLPTLLRCFRTIFKHFDANYTANVEHMIDN